MNYITKKIDKLGRIVLPMDFRRALGISLNSDVRIELIGNEIRLNNAELQCKLCGTAIKKECTMQICKECIRKVKSIQ